MYLNGFIFNLWATSEHAIELINGLSTFKCSRKLLHNEIKRIYQILIPSLKQQNSALKLYKHWLKTTNLYQRGAINTPFTYSIKLKANEIMEQGKHVVWWSVVARLCHIQAVRLVGLYNNKECQLKLECIEAILNS